LTKDAGEKDIIGSSTLPQDDTTLASCVPSCTTNTVYRLPAASSDYRSRLPVRITGFLFLDETYELLFAVSILLLFRLSSKAGFTNF